MKMCKKNIEITRKLIMFIVYRVVVGSGDESDQEHKI